MAHVRKAIDRQQTAQPKHEPNIGAHALRLHFQQMEWKKKKKQQITNKTKIERTCLIIN